MNKSEISFMNTIFCLLVIFIHTASAPVVHLSKNSPEWLAVFVPWRMSAFVVQGFIFLSGMKMFLKFGTEEKFNYKKYYLSRFKKIIIPYIISVCIFYVYFLHHNYFVFSIKDLCGYVLNGTLVSHFYFVIIIVQFYLLRPIWYKMLVKIPAAAAILAALAVTVFGVLYQKQVISALTGNDFAFNDRVFTTYIIYWVMGCYAGANYNKFKKMISDRKVRTSVLFCFAGICEIFFSYMQFSGKANIPYLEVIHIFYCINAVMFCYVCAVSGGKNIMRKFVFKEINKCSYYIYLIHPLFIFIADDKINALGLRQGTAMLIRSAAVYICSVLFCGIYVKEKEEIKAVLLLRKKS